MKIKNTIILIFSTLFFHSVQSQEIRQKGTTKDYYFTLKGKEITIQGDAYYEVNQIKIYDKKSNQNVQSIDGLNLSYYESPKILLIKNSLLIVQDINFDGLFDIRLKNSKEAIYEKYLIWLYNPVNSNFSRNNDFEKISSLISVDEGKQEIHNFTIENEKSFKSIYKVENNMPVFKSGRVDISVKYGQCCDTYNYFEREDRAIKSIKSFTPSKLVELLPNKLETLANFDNADSILQYFASMTIIETQPPIEEYDIPEGFVYTIYTGSLADISERVTIIVSKNKKIKEVNSNTPSSFWKIPFGLKCGMGIDELIKINGKPFSFSGFEIDHGGQVNWNGGKLQGKGIFVQLAFKGNKQPDFISYSEKVYSDNSKLKNINIYVSNITIRKN